MSGAGWAWVEHLEGGGTTRWSEFRASGATAPERDRVLPGVAQMELARRVNLLSPGRPHPVVGRILATGAPGRGPQDIPLAGAVARTEYGPRPMFPRAVPLEELVRVGTGVLAEELAARVPLLRAQGATASHGSGPPGLSTPQGPYPPKRWWPRRTLRLPVAPLDALLYDEWVARAQRGRVRPWPSWMKLLAESDRLPDTLDLPRIARRWDQAWWHRVELVPAREVARVDANAVAVVRRVNTLLGLLADEEGRQLLTATVVGPWLGGQDGPRLAVPEQHRWWVRARATRMAEQLADAGYRVREDLTVLPALDESSPTAASMEAVLDVTIKILRDGWEKR